MVGWAKETFPVALTLLDFVLRYEIQTQSEIDKRKLKNVFFAVQLDIPVDSN